MNIFGFMNKIEFHLNKSHNKVRFQIVNQKFDKYTTDLLKGGFKCGEFTIKICSRPELTPSRIYLRGDSKTSNFDIAEKTFGSNESRDKYYDSVLESFEILKKLLN